LGDRYSSGSSEGREVRDLVGSVEVRNLSEVVAGMNLTMKELDEAAFYAIQMASLEIERQARINADTGTRSYEKRVSASGRPYLKITPPKHIGPSGKGPNVVTGQLKRHITAQPPRKGFGTYESTVASTMIYARAVELGLPEWKGKRYPYLAPAAKTLKDSGQLARTFIGALRYKLGV
jgi:hypothetical protein